MLSIRQKKNMKILLRPAHVDDMRWLLLIILLSLLVSGFAIRLVEITGDSFDFDEYACMLNIDQSFSTYVKGYSGSVNFPELVHYWLSYRVLGESLIAYRTMSLFASLTLLILTTLCLRRLWPSKKGICLIVLSVLIINHNALYLTRYSYFQYGNDLLVSAGLFFLFMRLAEGPIGKKEWLLIGAAVLPAAFFSRITTMVPLATGTLLIIVFRWLRFTELRNLTSLWRWLWELKLLLVFPLTYLIIHILVPFTNLGIDKRPDMAPLFFPTSEYSHDYYGVAKFILSRTYSLGMSMIVPVFNDGFIRKAAMASWGFLAALTVVQVARRRADQRTVFSLFFLLITLVSILGASLLGLYPYGKVRYAPYLLIPATILIGFGGVSLLRWVAHRLALARTLKALLAFTAVIILVVGGYISIERYNNLTFIKESNYQTINWLKTQKPDLILSDSYIMPALSARAPKVYERSHSMGWRTFWGENILPSELVDVIRGARQSKPAASILVILNHKDIGRNFPHWNTLINTYFNLHTSLEAPNIWVGLYRRKAHDNDI